MMVRYFALAPLLYFIAIAAYADPLTCMHTAIADPDIVESKNALMREEQLLILCERARNEAPIRCYREAFKDKQIFPVEERWRRSVLIAHLCSEAPSNAPITCLKSASADSEFKSFFSPFRDPAFSSSSFLVGLCGGANSSEPIQCVKKAFDDPVIQESIMGKKNYITLTKLCGQYPDFTKYGENDFIISKKKQNFSNSDAKNSIYEKLLKFFHISNGQS